MEARPLGLSASGQPMEARALGLSASRQPTEGRALGPVGRDERTPPSETTISMSR